MQLVQPVVGATDNPMTRAVKPNDVRTEGRAGAMVGKRDGDMPKVELARTRTTAP